ncbi:MAG: DUF3536 domain-containing protein, partial [Acidobacteriota bacterium]
WRAPLREALDWLRDELAPRFERAAGELLHDPWAARNDSVDVLLERTDERLEAFFARHARRPLSTDEQLRVRYLMELQRHALSMYTSCGWFFHDLSGIETVQILLYADRALQLAERVFRDGITEGFVERLARAESNLPSPAGGTGREIYERSVRPARVDLVRVAAHYALSTLFEDYPEQARIFCYRADLLRTRTWRSGRSALAVGRLEVSSLITGSRRDVSFAVLHLGDHHIHGGVREFQGEKAFDRMADEVSAAFRAANLAEVVRVLDRSFRELTYTLDSLFTDERRAVLDRILRPTREAAEADHRQLYENHAPLMHYLAGLGIPLPLPLAAAAEVVLNLDLRRAFEDPESDLGSVRRMLGETTTWDLQLDVPGLTLALQNALEDLAETLRVDPGIGPRIGPRGAPYDPGTLSRLSARVELARELPFRIPLAGVQNAVYRVLRSDYPAALEAAREGDRNAAAWAERFRALADKLELRVEAEPAPAGAGSAGPDG